MSRSIRRRDKESDLVLLIGRTIRDITYLMKDERDMNQLNEYQTCIRKVQDFCCIDDAAQAIEMITAVRLGLGLDN